MHADRASDASLLEQSTVTDSSPSVEGQSTTQTPVDQPTDDNDHDGHAASAGVPDSTTDTLLAITDSGRADQSLHLDQARAAVSLLFTSAQPALAYASFHSASQRHQHQSRCSQ